MRRLQQSQRLRLRWVGEHLGEAVPLAETKVAAATAAATAEGVQHGVAQLHERSHNETSVAQPHWHSVTWQQVPPPPSAASSEAPPRHSTTTPYGMKVMVVVVVRRTYAKYLVASKDGYECE